MFKRGFQIITVVLLVFQGGQTLNEESAKEQPCFNISKTVHVDSEEMGQLTKIYYPFMSRLDLYRTARDVLGQRDWKDISESELYYSACLEFDCKNDSISAHGFHDRTATYLVRNLTSTFDIIQWKLANSSEYFGTCYTTLTDNKTFIFNACCFTDNQMTWGVSSPYKTLSKEAVALIHEHAISLGFKKEYFTELRYDWCDVKKNSTKKESCNNVEDVECH